jgi:glycosyltransferase involved in cell wall biosynthesis
VSDRLRVLVVPKWYPWPERPVFGLFCREHARALATRHDVVVLASLATRRPDFAAYRLEDSVEDGIRTLRVRYRRPFLRPAAMGFQTLGMLAALRRLRREGWRPDVVHAHVYQAGPPALILGRRAGAPVVVTEHYTGFQRGLVTGYDRLLAKGSFERAELVAPVSGELAARLRELAPRARIEVVPNVVDTDVFAPPAEHPPHEGPSRLLNVAELAEKKGQRFLLTALADLPAVTLDVVGEGPEREPLLRQARELGIEDRVRLHGAQPRERVAELMRAADLFVLPSLHENLPVVLIESQATGLPAVASDVGGVSELVDGDAGLLVPAGDPAALTAAIRRALEGRERFDAAALARRAHERYGYAAICARWTTLYEGLGVKSPDAPRSASADAA